MKKIGTIEIGSHHVQFTASEFAAQFWGACVCVCVCVLDSFLLSYSGIRQGVGFSHS